MYKEASKIGLRFSTNKGLLSVEQLWQLTLTDLDSLAVSLDEAYEKSGKKSYLTKQSVKDKETKLRRDIVVDVLRTKVEENAVLQEARDIKEHNQKILSLIAEKQDDELKGKSVKQLEKLLK